MSDNLYKFEDVTVEIDYAELKIGKIKDRMYPELERLKELKKQLEKLEEDLNDYQESLDYFDEKLEKYQKIKESKNMLYASDDVMLELDEKYYIKNGKYYASYRVVPEFRVKRFLGYEQKKEIINDRSDASCGLSGEMHCEYYEYTKIIEEPVYDFEWDRNLDYECISEKKREILFSYIDKELSESQKQMFHEKGECYSNWCKKRWISSVIKKMKDKGYELVDDKYVGIDVIRDAYIFMCSEKYKEDLEEEKFVLTSYNETEEENSKTMILKK